LDLAGAEITDEAVAILNRMPNLTHLDLQDCAVSPSTVSALTKLKHTEWLLLWNSWSTDKDQFPKLQKALPNTRVEYGYVHEG
jgi:hypothetical protein